MTTVLALAAVLLSLALEHRVMSRLYEYFYKETPEEREDTPSSAHATSRRYGASAKTALVATGPKPALASLSQKTDDGVVARWMANFLRMALP